MPTTTARPERTRLRPAFPPVPIELRQTLNKRTPPCKSVALICFLFVWARGQRPQVCLFRCNHHNTFWSFPGSNTRSAGKSYRAVLLQAFIQAIHTRPWLFAFFFFLFFFSALHLLATPSTVFCLFCAVRLRLSVHHILAEVRLFLMEVRKSTRERTDWQRDRGSYRMVSEFTSFLRTNGIRCTPGRHRIDTPTGREVPNPGFFLPDYRTAFLANKCEPSVWLSSAAKFYFYAERARGGIVECPCECFSVQAPTRCSH